MARTRRQRKAQVPTPRLILDSGAVIAWARGDARARAILTRALEIGPDVRIPVAVLAETLRGGPRDAPVHRVRNAVDVFPTDEQTSHRGRGPAMPTTCAPSWRPIRRRR